MTIKLLFDTDIGSDIDDAFCLAYLLAQDECELLGITTVTGEAKRRAMMASAICTAMGKDVPIVPGRETPLVGEVKQKQAPQAEALSGLDHMKEFPEGGALDFLAETIRENPNDVILLSVGSLTNVGELFLNDPGAAGLLRGLVAMCGDFRSSGPVAEWNASGDPRATEIVFNTPLDLHRSLGLNVTSEVKMSMERVLSTFRSSRAEPVMDFAEVWFRTNDSVTFHDPLAAATVFRDDICRFETGRVKVDIDDGRAFTRWSGDPSGGHEVAVSVDPSIFFEHFCSVLEGE